MKTSIRHFTASLRRWAVVLALVRMTGISPLADASVFQNHSFANRDDQGNLLPTRWPAGAGGWVIVQVCIDPSSTAQEDPDGNLARLVVAPNPTLDEVIRHVRKALASSWERYSSIRFVGWNPCGSPIQPDGVHLFIHPNAKDETLGIGFGEIFGQYQYVQFTPWGIKANRCIQYNFSTARVEYTFDCVEQYAIHEFGHALGFDHEFDVHPDASAPCRALIDPTKGQTYWSSELVDNPSEYSAIFDPTKRYTIVNSTFDRLSIMTYHDPECSERSGTNNIRFGSTNLSAVDKQGLQAVYSTPGISRFYDVGVLAEAAGCGADTETVTMFMDNEDSNGQTSALGWSGATRIDRNIHWVFCRADGTRFHPFKPPSPGSRLADYAVLQLGSACPAGSRPFSRYIDNEDGDNQNFTTGLLGPNAQNQNGSSSTEFHFCLFQPELAPDSLMTGFPDLSHAYGVFAKYDAPFVGAGGTIYSDDEDSNNQDHFTYSDPSMADAVQRIIYGDHNTTFFVSLVGAIAVSDAVPPTTTAAIAPPPNAYGWNRTIATVALTATDNAGGSGVNQIDFDLSGAQILPAQAVAGSTASALIGLDGHTNVTYHAIDNAGNAESSKTLTVNIDRTPPLAKAALTPAPNANGWNNSSVTVSFSGTDNLSGIAACTGPTLMSSEGAQQVVSGNCSDRADNISAPAVALVYIDKTPPVAALSLSPVPNANGWNNTNVTVTFAGKDLLSGIDHCSAPVPLTAEGAGQGVSGNCTDRAGNVSAPAAGKVNIDKTPPVISGMPAAGCTIWPVNGKLVQVGVVTASDLLSGVAPGSFTVTGASNEPSDPQNPDVVISPDNSGGFVVQLRAARSGAGNGRIYTLTSSALDRAGNPVTATATCTVPHDQGR